MKKLLLSALAVCAFTFANAQEETTSTDGSLAKGDVMISGTLGFGSESQDIVKTNNFDFSPSATYLVSDKIGVGVKVGFGAGKGENVDVEFNGLVGNADEAKTTDLSVGAFGRYFFTPASKFSLFGELGFNYNTSKSEITEAGVTLDAPDSKGFDVAVGPGICYFVSSNFAIEANWGALGYKTSKIDMAGAESKDEFGLNLDLADINFGLAYKF